MSSFIIPAVIAGVVILIAVGYFVLRPSERKTERAPEPGNVLDKAWARYVKSPREWSERDRQAITKFADLDAEASRKLQQSVREIVDEAMAAENPEVALRQAIMDATDHFVMVETLSAQDGDEVGTAQTRSDHFESVLKVGLLRCVSMLKFQDYSKNDWYSHYLGVAEMNSKNVAAMVRTTVRGEQGSLESSLHDPLAQTMRQVRQTLLKQPRQTPVRRADKLTTEEEVRPLFPTQQQVDRLTKTMGDRFEKLFSGQLYQQEQGPAINPAAAFQVDAGLLYVLLSLRFRHHDDAWRQIMGEALGRHKETMLRNEDELIERSKEFRRVWQANQSGPLGPMLKAACRMAFETPGSDPASEDAHANGMMQDAGLLVGAIRDVVD